MNIRKALSVIGLMVVLVIAIFSINIYNAPGGHGVGAAIAGVGFLIAFVLLVVSLLGLFWEKKKVRNIIVIAAVLFVLIFAIAGAGY